ncbi:MAG: hypothetical protein FJY80_01575 [Candidatus Aminicenantes bacterium]|nr:hypothetical protein [Candidatus Aminicenantes bacterium]
MKKRPAFGGGFLLLLAVLLAVAHRPLRSEIEYPWKEAFLGALDSRGWGGLVWVPQKDAGFAIRFAFERNGQTVDGHDLFYMISEVGPNSPDGKYARVRFDLGLPVLPADRKNDTPIFIKPADKDDTVTLEWSRVDERTAVGRLTAPSDATVRLVHYFPWDFKGRYAVSGPTAVRGEAKGGKIWHSLLWTDRPGEPSAAAGVETLAQTFGPQDRQSVAFVFGIGEDFGQLEKLIYRYQNSRTIGAILEEEKDRFDRRRLRLEGPSEGAAEAVINNLGWMVLYQPGFHRLYTPAGRGWIFDRPDGLPDHWQILARDSFFNGLQLAVESSRLAADATRAVLDTQFANGNIPHWRSRFGGTPDRSQPPVGAYCVLKLFQKTGDLALLEYAYPILRRWHAFWKAKKPNGQARRDGNGDGLLEWGSDRELVPEKVPPGEANATAEQRAKWESGQDDLPNWDDVPVSPETGTFMMNCLDLNCLYALDAWCLKEMADILGRPEEHDAYAAEYETLKALINDQLWNPREGFYFDRFWNGKFSTRKAASNFYPLLARIPDEARARLLRRRLLNPKEFWGEYVLPSISRDDPAFTDPGNAAKPYWRGTIWPPTNYLVYQGLKAYGFDNEASEFARKSLRLFLRAWTNFQICPENFHPLTGEATGQRHQSWGPLFALVALEEYVDFTPWEGFRFGVINPEEDGALMRVAIQGRHYDVIVEPKDIVLREEGRDILSLNGGAVVRHFLYAASEVGFEISAMKARKVKVALPQRGKYQLLVDGAPKKILTGRRMTFEVPDGNHTVLIQLLESLE